MTRPSTRVWTMLVCLVLAMLMTACAGPQAITSQVSSAGNWPEGRKPGRYVFERLPSQQAQTELQDKLEAAAQSALAAAGFELVTDADKADKAEISVQVGSRINVEQRPAYYYDPFWGPYGPWRPGMGGYWGPGRGGLALSMSMEPPRVTMAVDLLIRDRHSNQVLYETHARYDRFGAADERFYPFMFEAAMKDFPHQAVSPREVTVTIPQDNR